MIGHLARKNRRIRVRRGVAAIAGIAALGLGVLPVVHASAASGVTSVKILSTKVTGSGDLQLRLSVQCPKGDNNYLYAEVDQDLYTNEASGNVYVSSFICKGWAQNLTATVAHGTGISHMDYNNDIESDDLGTFASGMAA